MLPKNQIHHVELESLCTFTLNYSTFISDREWRHRSDIIQFNFAEIKGLQCFSRESLYTSHFLLLDRERCTFVSTAVAVIWCHDRCWTFTGLKLLGTFMIIAVRKNVILASIDNNIAIFHYVMDFSLLKSKLVCYGDKKSIRAPCLKRSRVVWDFL